MTGGDSFGFVRQDIFQMRNIFYGQIVDVDDIYHVRYDNALRCNDQSRNRSAIKRAETVLLLAG